MSFTKNVFFVNLCEIIRKYNLSDNCCNAKLVLDLNNKLSSCLVESGSLLRRLESCQDTNRQVFEEINEISDELIEKNREIDRLNSLLPKVDPRLIELEKKYPPVDVILYNGWVLNGTSVPVPVADFITPDSFYVKQFVIDSKVIPVDFEFAIPKLYKFYMDNVFQYAYDRVLYGLSERWDLPFEVFARYYQLKTRGFGDCEAHAVVLKSLFNALGLPDWKSRVFCGNVPSGEGHATLAVFSEVSNRFHHMNSTGVIGAIPEKISDFPTMEDGYGGIDKNGIKVPWFSFTKDKYYVGRFSSGAKKGFKKSKLFTILLTKKTFL